MPPYSSIILLMKLANLVEKLVIYKLYIRWRCTLHTYYTAQIFLWFFIFPISVNVYKLKRIKRINVILNFVTTNCNNLIVNRYFQKYLKIIEIFYRHWIKILPDTEFLDLDIFSLVYHTLSSSGAWYCNFVGNSWSYWRYWTYLWMACGNLVYSNPRLN